MQVFLEWRVWGVFTVVLEAQGVAVGADLVLPDLVQRGDELGRRVPVGVVLALHHGLHAAGEDVALLELADAVVALDGMRQRAVEQGEEGNEGKSGGGLHGEKKEWIGRKQCSTNSWSVWKRQQALSLYRGCGNNGTLPIFPPPSFNIGRRYGHAECRRERDREDEMPTPQATAGWTNQEMAGLGGGLQ